MPPDVRTGARWMVERAQAAAAAGLDSLFVGDHHAVPVPYYQNVAIMGRLLAEWDTRPAGVLMLLPLWQPVLAAEQIGTLASIAQGPFILQCAVGGGLGPLDHPAGAGAHIGGHVRAAEGSSNLHDLQPRAKITSWRHVISQPCPPAAPNGATST